MHRALDQDRRRMKTLLEDEASTASQQCPIGLVLLLPGLCQQIPSDGTAMTRPSAPT
jgi:hypothetical protein